VPQVVESDVRQPRPFQDRLKVLEHEAVHIHWSSKLRDEDKIDTFRPLFVIDNWVFFLTPLLVLKDLTEFMKVLACNVIFLVIKEIRRKWQIAEPFSPKR